MPVVADVPGVGEDLQDHLAAHLQHTSTQPVTFGVLRQKRNWPSIGAQWLIGHSGPGATNIFEAGGFVKTRPEMTIPDLMLGFAPVAMKCDPDMPVHRTSDKEILDWVARGGQTGLHPTSRCRMGTDAMAVVDPSSMAVHGVEGLQVVDASVMPYCPNGATHAPTMMLAERASDLILGRTPMAPEHLDRGSPRSEQTAVPVARA